ncbi:gamma carbonic anhydrase family protein [Pseudoalteromonas ruthenica]|uniref:gamma carbonic anhydrase family protein n=1 Tax=Pseudoalteromonas ruthenica TaxID=151081 RepID=UPI00110AB9A9|nr:gamma carbonic anhydrase family protein [Pseudoalteromonas ruthenica]TMO84117.1 gamma carbonic anhydrase family protein [Pseudoalteromonas ruthenica]TMP22245.1 gamma carbonic anhydrase family protein [Pseudoalteromonas ruthenica]
MTIQSYKGKAPNIDKTAYVHESAVLVGDIEVAENASIWPLVAARGDVNYMRIGKRTNIQDGSVLHLTRASKAKPEGYPLIIGDDVTVGHKAMLHGCKLGNRILVGMGAIIMDNVTVEDDVIIAGGALVPPNKTLLSGYLYVGSPAKQARPLSDDERTFLKVSADNYVRLKDEYLNEVVPVVE